MHLDLTDEQTALLVAELDRIIENDRYQFSARIEALRAIRTLRYRSGPARVMPY
jgi:hypothetical protein